MLTLTENASTIVKDVTAQLDGPETAGLRITSDAAMQGLVVTAAPQPEPDDQVIDQAGAHVYLDPPAAQMLEDQVLDASVDDAGQIQFALAPQA